MRHLISITLISFLLSCKNNNSKQTEIYQNLDKIIKRKLTEINGNLQYSSFFHRYGNSVNVEKINEEVNTLIIHYQNNTDIDTTINNYFRRKKEIAKNINFIPIDKALTQGENLMIIKLNELNLIDNILSSSSNYLIGTTSYSGQFILNSESDSISKGSIALVRTDTISSNIWSRKHRNWQMAISKQF